MLRNAIRLLTIVLLLAGCARRASENEKTLGTIFIQSDPPGAQLYLNDRFAGTTPFKFTETAAGFVPPSFIAPPLEEITVRKRGFFPETEVITKGNYLDKLNLELRGEHDDVRYFEGNLTLYLEEQESPAAKEYGKIQVKTTPDDTEIFLDNTLIGNTATEELTLEAGTYVLKVKKPGHVTWERVVQVLPNNTITITCRLEPVQTLIDRSLEEEDEGAAEEEMEEEAPE